MPHEAVPHLCQGGHQHLQRLPAPRRELRQPGQVRRHHYEPTPAPNEVTNYRLREFPHWGLTENFGNEQAERRRLPASHDDDGDDLSDPDRRSSN